MRVVVNTQGGQRIRRLMEVAERGGGFRAIEVGFFASARYPEGTPVAHVAAINEFGTDRIPERPFFRGSVAKMETELMPVLRSGINTETMQVDGMLADKLGAHAAGVIQTTIAKGTFHPNPPNAPSTIARKTKGQGGEVTTLIDTGKLRQSVTWRVHR